ncbi:MAG: aminopeptidase P family protein [Elusimicrobia bacterium]|nr:aminopeptidase P family protein [Elusimicrobiota bacterium]
MIARRCRRVFEFLEKQRVEAALTVSESDIFYFTGTRVSSCALLFQNGRTIVFANPMFEEIFPGAKPLRELAKIRTRSLVVEPQKISYEKLKWIESFDGIKKIVPAGNFFSRIRAIKDREEIGKIARAQEISKKILKNVRIEKGQTEELVLRKILTSIAKASEGVSFEPIVAFGKNTSRPHHTATLEKYRKGDIALIDMGVKFKGYCSDLTRIKGLFNIKNPLQSAYKAVMEARNHALGEIREGVRIGKADEVIREFLEKRGFGGNILHSSGHGIGIDVHEWPPISRGVKEQFRKGMVFALEPGIYFRGVGGVRIEDVFVIDGGAKVL